MQHHEDKPQQYRAEPYDVVMFLHALRPSVEYVAVDALSVLCYSAYCGLADCVGKGNSPFPTGIATFVADRPPLL